MTTVSLYTLLQAVHTYLVENPLSPDADSNRKEMFVLVVSNLDNRDLPCLHLKFWCYSKKIPNQPKFALCGRSRLHLGFAGWHWGRDEGETKFTIKCVQGQTPLQAVQQLISDVEAVNYHR
jgi:hypothetical protein